MAQSVDRRKAALIDKIAAHARDKAGKAKADTVERVVRQYYAHVPPEDVLCRSVEDLAGGALSLWEFMQKRKPGRPIIRAFNPDPAKCAWDCPHTVIEVVNDDMPFLVDSITAELNRQHLTAHLIIHPVVSVRRSKEGALTALSDNGSGEMDAISESIMHIEINEQARTSSLREIEKNVLRVLADVRAAVDDWRAMRVKIADVVAEFDSRPPPVAGEETQEAAAFLRWLDDRNFTFLGYREYAFSGGGQKATLSVVPKSGLGLLRKDTTSVFEGMEDGAVLPPDITAFLRQPTLLMVSKANRRSTVHRAVHLDTIGIKKYDKAGQVIGERLFVGLFTSSVYHQAAEDIPLLRRKVRNVVSRAGFPMVSHNGKALLHILETLPREDMFQYDDQDLYETSVGILHLQERQRVALFVRRDPFGRFVSCLIFMPRERYTTALREAMQQIVEKGFGGRVTMHYIQVSDSVLGRLQLIVKTTPGVDFPRSLEEIEEQLAEAGRDWRDSLNNALVDTHGEARGLDLFRIYAEAFPAAYRERFSAHAAISDIAKIETVLATGELAMDLHRWDGMAANEVRLKIYNRDAPVPLSDVLPMLENMGLKVIGEIPNRIEPSDSQTTVQIHDFGMASSDGATIDLEAVKQNFEEAFARIWRGDMDNDGFNRLVIGAGLAWRQVVVLRAYSKYLRQAAIPFSQTYMEETLAKNASITRGIVQLFECLFDPKKQKDATAQAIRLNGQIIDALEAVENLDEDRILRRFHNVVASTLRTNFFQMDEAGTPKVYISFKLDSQEIDDLPLPKPHVEVFVYSPRVEAVHLRGGKVARGGIRWSDRREDFRTEILGLMKAQMTKNAVIVPVGAKGGFVVKRPPTEGGREALQAEGIECYKTFMRGLLDITDNLTTRKLVYPKNVVRRDGDDPYLVVAADKGTATFSDIANGIARDYGFWLDDAFASGGSAGYDHKKMGITARGAWESVKRHFRELGVDTQTQDFTCVGVGDMSGDVFGNGMLLSKHIKLVAAFNHLHVFVDPDPDPAVGYKERKRLFGLPRSSWIDYNADLISKGGGVFDRKAKSIKVSAEMRRVLDFQGKDSVTPNELIRAILRAPVDLLWFGGIGTYVKSAEEAHADAGDRVNDPLRLNAPELRCKVVGEGANLGVTQLGRIDYALLGGRINTDFIDNSAGVGTSDHEVNIKILLGEVLAAKKLAEKDRDKLLADMTDELAEHVLMDNYRQSMALTHAEAQASATLDESARFIRQLERAGRLDRAVEFLPDDEELEIRRAAGGGLTRPELSVLLAYSKMTLYDELLASDVPDDKYLFRDIGLYFPSALRERFGDFVPKHRLRREISATYITNSLVNRAGPTFINELQEKMGAPPGQIARAYLVCRQIFGLREMWADIEALDNKVPAESQTEMNLAIQRLIKRGTIWMLRNGPKPLDVAPAVARFAPGIAALTEGLEQLLSPELKEAVEKAAKRFTNAKVPEKLARRIASLDALFPACDIVRIAAGGGYDAAEVARVYYAIGAKFGLDWLRAAAESMSAETEWQTMAISAIVDDLYAQQSALATKVVDEAGGTRAAPAVIEAWSTANGHGIDRVETMIGDLRRAGNVDLAMLAVANREIRSLITH